ncbi:MAG: alanyl-tRNA editing protein [Candidatus Micrarchaeia archaeon]
MTRLLCLEDSYLRECDAVVVSARGNEVELDQTVFYPRGGGQPSDTGRIVLPDGRGSFVAAVSKRDGLVVHELAADAVPPRAGDKVRCIIDWFRRYRLMRMHTAAHVLAAKMHSELGILISGNQIEEDKARFDFTMEEFDRSVFEMVVGKANEALSSDTELKVYQLPREQAMGIPGVVKLAGALPPSVSMLRMVEIPGIDIQADGGTHVKALREVGRILILRLDNKGKANRRIYFTLSD